MPTRPNRWKPKLRIPRRTSKSDRCPKALALARRNPVLPQGRIFRRICFAPALETGSRVKSNRGGEIIEGGRGIIVTPSFDTFIKLAPQGVRFVFFWEKKPKKQ